MYKKIMVPLDGSELAECVFPHVEAFIKAFNSIDVLLVRVVEPEDMLSYRGEGTIDPQILVQRETSRVSSANDYLNQVAKRLKHEGTASLSIPTIAQTDCPIQSPLYHNIAENVAECLARGGKEAGVAAMHGISRVTIDNWMKREHFLALIAAKKEEWRKKLLSRIEEAGQQKNLWAANSWLLERSPVFGGEYAQPVKGQGGGGVAVQLIINMAGQQIDPAPIIEVACEEEK